MKSTGKWAVVLLGLVSVSMAGCGSSYSSPESVFEAAKSSANAGNWKKFCTCLTPESRDGMAVGLIAMGAMAQSFAGLGGDQGDTGTFEKINKVM